MCVCVRVRMVTEGQRERAQDRRTNSRTAGDRAGQEQVVQGTAGGQEGRTAGDSDGQERGRRGTWGQGQQDRSGERERERTTTWDYSKTGGLKRTSSVIVMQ